MWMLHVCNFMCVSFTYFSFGKIECSREPYVLYMHTTVYALNFIGIFLNAPQPREHVLYMHTIVYALNFIGIYFLLHHSPEKHMYCMCIQLYMHWVHRHISYYTTAQRTICTVCAYDCICTEFIGIFLTAPQPREPYVQYMHIIV
jgi:hypothetical protein